MGNRRSTEQDVIFLKQMHKCYIQMYRLDVDVSCHHEPSHKQNYIHIAKLCKEQQSFEFVLEKDTYSDRKMFPNRQQLTLT